MHDENVIWALEPSKICLLGAMYSQEAVRVLFLARYAACKLRDAGLDLKTLSSPVVRLLSSCFVTCGPRRFSSPVSLRVLMTI